MAHKAWTGGDEPVAICRRRLGQGLLAGAGIGLIIGPGGVGRETAAAASITGHSPWRRLGDTTAATFRAEFERMGSPMAREAEAIRGEVDGFSRLFLAMSFHETKHSTASDVIPESYSNALAIKAGNGSGRWARYPTYQAAARIWVRLLTNPDGPYADAVSIRDLISIYAPRFDNNKVTVYVSTIVDQINSYPLTPVRTPDRPAKDDQQRTREARRDRPARTRPDPDPGDGAPRSTDEPQTAADPGDGEPRPRTETSPKN